MKLQTTAFDLIREQQTTASRPTSVMVEIGRFYYFFFVIIRYLRYLQLNNGDVDYCFVVVVNAISDLQVL